MGTEIRKEIERKTVSELSLVGIVIANGEKFSAKIGEKHAKEILEKFPEGRFNSSEYDVRRIDSTTNSAFSSDDNLKVDTVIYWGDSSSDECVKISFKEYVKLGRYNRIRSEQTVSLTPLDE